MEIVNQQGYIEKEINGGRTPVISGNAEAAQTDIHGNLYVEKEVGGIIGRIPVVELSGISGGTAAPHRHPINSIDNLPETLNKKADLDISGRILDEQLPTKPIITIYNRYIGDSVDMQNVSPNIGDICIVLNDNNYTGNTTVYVYEINGYFGYSDWTHLKSIPNLGNTDLAISENRVINIDNPDEWAYEDPHLTFTWKNKTSHNYPSKMILGGDGIEVHDTDFKIASTDMMGYKDTIFSINDQYVEINNRTLRLNNWSGMDTILSLSANGEVAPVSYSDLAEQLKPYLGL